MVNITLVLRLCGTLLHKCNPSLVVVLDGKERIRSKGHKQCSIHSYSGANALKSKENEF